jgi:hypothetical protein
MQPLLPFNLVGCTVEEVEWPARGFRLVLSGKTAKGQPVAGYRVTFEAVANVYPLRMFLSEKRILIPKGTIVGGRPQPYSHNKSELYPLKLPAKLTHFRRSTAAKVTYGDRAFTDCHGPPPALQKGQLRMLFALAEKRFKNRGPFPILCNRVNLTDAKGKVLGGEVNPPERDWPEEDFLQLGRRFAVAVLGSDKAAARACLSRECRQRLGAKGLNRVISKCADGRRLLHNSAAYGYTFDTLFEFGAETDPALVWESVQGGRPVGLPPEAVRGIVSASSEGLREGLFALYVVEEGGELRIGRVMQ